MKFKNHLVSIFVVLILAFIIISLPPFLLDFMFVVNIALSLMILLMTMYVKEALQFSIFPSMLLITTIFRLALNISSTRLILMEEGNAGQVVATFGEFVLKGNIVVGFIIFFIIVIVQFMVITKGAERVAEVSARFTLDAMPGKQMAIDADLSSGLISEEMAKERRYKVQKEAEFYGSMDGATKFVKGDAIMSILITFINFLGGTIIGMVQGSSTFTEVLNTYSIATVGDGLVSQIPALLISTATGMIVTRAASDSSLGEDVTRQFTSQPMVLLVSGFSLCGLALVPGMPIPQILVLAAILVSLGFVMGKKAKRLAASGAPGGAVGGLSGGGGGGGLPPPSEAGDYQDETEYYKNIDNIYELLQIDAVEMDFGYSLIPMVDEASGSNFISRLVMLRKNFAMEMGVVIPAIRMREDGMINPNQYVIKIKGEEINRGEILMDYFLALDPGNLTGEIDGIETIEPAYGIPSKWITPDKKDLAEIYGYTVIDPLSVVITHLSEMVRRHAHELLTRQDVNQLLDNLKKTNPTLVDEVIPALIPFSGFQKILTNLVKEGIPIRDIETILETITEFAPTVRDVEVMTEYVRQALKRTITRKWSEEGQIKVITLDGEVEKLIVNSIQKNQQGAYLAIDPQTAQEIIINLIEAIKKVNDIIRVPVILTSPVIRLYFSKMLEQFQQNAVVLSFNELDTNVQIQAIANVTLN